MASKAKKARVKKPKTEGGRKPTMAPFMDGPLNIYARYQGKEYSAVVLSSGVIRYDEKEYASPSAAARAIMGNYKGKPLQVDGWKFWKYNDDGQRREIDALRGSKSPLKEAKEEKAA